MCATASGPADDRSAFVLPVEMPRVRNPGWAPGTPRANPGIPLRTETDPSPQPTWLVDVELVPLGIPHEHAAMIDLGIIRYLQDLGSESD